MTKKQKISRELFWFFGSLAVGFIFFIYVYSFLNVDFTLETLILGAVVTLLAMYVIRLTLWVFKKSL